MMGSFSVLIPNYNGASLIRATVDRFEAGFPGVRIVVVDDASTDDSLARLSATSVHVVVRERNGGFAG